jgi:hypothetical protein
MITTLVILAMLVIRLRRRRHMRLYQRTVLVALLGGH